MQMRRLAMAAVALGIMGSSLASSGDTRVSGHASGHHLDSVSVVDDHDRDGHGKATAKEHHEVAAAAAGEPFGDAGDHGSMAGRPLAQPVVGMASTPTGRGYWLVARDGGIFSFGDARFFGSTGAIKLNQPIVGMTSSSSGHGYWFVAADGGVFSFGDAEFRGSTGDTRLPAPIVGMASTPTGLGYWLARRDGVVHAFGDAQHLGNRQGPSPVVAITATRSGRGYWLVGADGTVSAHGDATPADGSSRRGVGFVDGAEALAGGLWVVAATGEVVGLGGASELGSAYPSAAVVGMAATPSGRGYWLVTEAGDVLVRAERPPAGAYEFISRDADGSPVRYNPCQPIRYVINPERAPARGIDDVHEAFRRIGVAMGVEFVFEGHTSETHRPYHQDRRPLYQPERYGTGVWAPILVSWATERDEPALRGYVVGVGGSSWYRAGPHHDTAYVTGEIVLDVNEEGLRPGFGQAQSRGVLLLHEIGHAVGLGHVDDPSQVMAPSLSPTGPSDLAAGDRAGLQELGIAKGCLRPYSPR